jgi:hypothetical protein
VSVLFVTLQLKVHAVHKFESGTVAIGVAHHQFQHVPSIAQACGLQLWLVSYPVVQQRLVPLVHVSSKLSFVIHEQ